MLVLDFDGCWLAEVDFYALAHDGFTIENLADADRGCFIEEGDDDASEGFQRCP